MARRVAVVAGLRTPFVRSGTAFRDVSTLGLATGVVTEMVERANLDPGDVDLLVYGTVVPDLRGPNIAREVVLAGNFPEKASTFSGLLVIRRIRVWPISSSIRAAGR